MDNVLGGNWLILLAFATFFFFFEIATILFTQQLALLHFCLGID